MFYLSVSYFSIEFYIKKVLQNVTNKNNPLFTFVPLLHNHHWLFLVRLPPQAFKQSPHTHTHYRKMPTDKVPTTSTASGSTILNSITTITTHKAINLITLSSSTQQTFFSTITGNFSNGTTTTYSNLTNTTDSNFTLTSAADGGKKFLFVLLVIVSLAILFTLISLLVNLCSPPIEEVDPQMLAAARAKSKMKAAAAAASAAQSAATAAKAVASGKLKTSKSKTGKTSATKSFGKVAVKGGGGGGPSEVNTVKSTAAKPMLSAKEAGTSTNIKVAGKGGGSKVAAATASSSSALKNARKGSSAKDQKSKKQKKATAPLQQQQQQASSQQQKKKKK